MDTKHQRPALAQAGSKFGIGWALSFAAVFEWRCKR